MRWRRSLADGLAERPLDDVWVRTGAGVAAALGLWLLLLALTPGLRGLLPMSRRYPGVHAALDRDAASLVLRDRAVEVSGVQSVRVRTGRRKAAVRAVSHFRELDEVRADLDSALSAAVGELGLAKPPKLSVHVRLPRRDSAMLRTVNRVLLALAGLILVVVGGAVLATGFGAPVPSWFPWSGASDVLLSDADRTSRRDEGLVVADRHRDPRRPGRPRPVVAPRPAPAR